MNNAEESDRSQDRLRLPLRNSLLSTSHTDLDYHLLIQVRRDLDSALGNSPVSATLIPVLVRIFLMMRASNFDAILASSWSSSESRSCLRRAVLSNINHRPNTVSVNGVDNTKYIHKLRETCPFRSGICRSAQKDISIWWRMSHKCRPAERSPHTSAEVKKWHAENG